MKSSERILKRRRKRLLKSFERTARRFGRKLDQQYPDKSRDEILEQSRVEFDEIIPHIPSFPKGCALFEQIIIINAQVVALYKPMKRTGISPDQAFQIFYEIVDELHEKIPKLFRFIVRKIFFSSLYLKLMQATSRKVADHPEGWKIEYREGDGENCDWFFEASECGVIKFYRRQSVPELARYCNFVDYIQSRVFGLGLRQLSCLGSGDETCVECMKENRRTEMPNNLKTLI